MRKEGRLFKTTRNIIWRFLVIAMTMIANLIIPRYIIAIYGSEVNGLTSMVAQVLTIVNLIQAGLASSVTFLMYKPIEEKDRVRLASIILSAKRVYRFISLGIATVGLIASIILALFVESEISRSYIFVACLITCFDSAMSTYFTATGNVFLGAKQDGYLTSIISVASNVLSYMLKALIIIIKPHFVWLYITNIIVCVVNIFAYIICFKKRYKPYEPTKEEKKKVKRIPVPGVSYAAANEASHSIVISMLSVIVSSVAGLKAASVLSVYLVVVNCIKTLSSSIYSAFVPSFGSVVCEDDILKTNKIFEIYQFVLMTMNTYLYMCTAYLILPFIKIYTKGISDTEYINPILVILLMAYCIFYTARIPYNNTVYVKGLFKQTFLQPVVCAVVCLLIMYFLGKINYSYSVIGLIVFYAINTFYQHFRLPKMFKGFESHHFWNHLIVSVLGVGASTAISFLFPIEPSSFLLWFVYAIGVACICLIVTILLIILIDRKSLLTTFDYFKSRINKKTH